ncbi:MAG: vWA domain-containing protein [Planctomycetota bacterium]|nr:vWA domain-containing protein [Planctomycetota bacterium]
MKLAVPRFQGQSDSNDATDSLSSSQSPNQCLPADVLPNYGLDTPFRGHPPPTPQFRPPTGGPAHAHDQEPEHDAKTGLFSRHSQGMILSAFLHSILLVGLALWMLPQQIGNAVVNLAASFDVADPLALDDSELLLNLGSWDTGPLETSAGSFEPEMVEVSETAAELVVSNAWAPGSPGNNKPADQPSDRLPSGSSTASATNPHTLRAAGSLRGALDQVTQQIRGQLAESDLLVVWLLDASHSLVDDRQRIAQRLPRFYEELSSGRDSSQHQLANAVVAFGARIKERIGPTDFGPKVARAVEKLPVDPSGKEMVFTAIATCIEKYHARQQGEQLMIVVWTDETGDDDHQLEYTLDLCQRTGTTVHVVGPSAVLGANTGLHSFSDPKTRRVFQLPVVRGPDAAFPERLVADYWFSDFVPQRFPAWQGGAQLKGLASGFSPYALTRLTRLTEGHYTIFDRPSDRGPFASRRLRTYLPSYDSRDAYEQDIQSHPLRRAVMTVVRDTLANPIASPQMQFFARVTKGPAAASQRLYYTPAQFSLKLKNSLRGLLTKARRISVRVEQALEVFEQPELALAYEAESPRWQAWHDLTKGRLLAISVRLEEYRLTCEELKMPNVLAPTTNYMRFTPRSQMRGESHWLQRAHDAEALLRRCVNRHTNTPWAVLAQRELRFELGVGVQQMSLRLVRGRGGGGRPNLPNF